MDKLLSRRRDAQRIHFRRRVRERLGFDLSEEEIDGIRVEVQSGVLSVLATPVDRLNMYRVDIGQRSCVIVYDKETQELVTLLTDVMWQARRLSNAPGVEDKTALKASLEDTPAGKVLQQLKDKI